MPISASTWRERALAELHQPTPNFCALEGLKQDLREEDVPLLLSSFTASGDTHRVGVVLLDAAEAPRRAAPRAAAVGRR